MEKRSAPPNGIQGSDLYPARTKPPELQHMRPRTFIVNFKNYPEVMGEGSLRLAKAAAGLSGSSVSTS